MVVLDSSAHAANQPVLKVKIPFFIFVAAAAVCLCLATMAQHGFDDHGDCGDSFAGDFGGGDGTGFETRGEGGIADRDGSGGAGGD